jgi:hypothetical protein
MNIRNLAAYQSSVWDWSWLNGAFGGSLIRVSDIDGMVERRGNFLMFEGKKGGVVSNGQSIMFDAWVRNGNALLLLHGMDHGDRDMIIVARGGLWSHESSPINGNRQTVRRLCDDWYQWANQNPRRGVLG